MYLNASRFPSWMWHVAALLVVLGLAGAVRASPVAAGTLAYVAGSQALTIIDTGTQKIVDTIPLGSGPLTIHGIAVAPDGKHVYAAISDNGLISSGKVLAIDIWRKQVVPIPLRQLPQGIAVTPDGKKVYVSTSTAIEGMNYAIIIDAARKWVVRSVPLGGFSPGGIAIRPDGRKAYIGNASLPGDQLGGVVQELDTHFNKLVPPIPNPFAAASNKIVVTPGGEGLYVTNINASRNPCSVSIVDLLARKVTTQVELQSLGPCIFSEIAISPDGTRVYVPLVTISLRQISVIETATNQLLPPIPVEAGAVAVTPDGKQLYGTTGSSVLVIDTQARSVLKTISVPGGASAIVIAPPNPLHFYDARLWLRYSRGHDHDYFGFMSFIRLGHDGNGIDPVNDPVTFQIGTYRKTIPAGSFRRTRYGRFEFHGVTGGIYLDALIERTGRNSYFVAVRTWQANLKGIGHPVPVTLMIGDDRGTVSVNPFVLHDALAKGP